MNACSQKQIDKIPGQISPAITRKQENISISPETNPGVVVGVSMAIGKHILRLVFESGINPQAQPQAKI